MEKIFFSEDNEQKWRNGQFCKVLQNFGDGWLLIEFRNGDVMEATEREVRA